MKKIASVVLAVSMSIAMASASFAAGWYQGDDGLWRFQNKDGSMATNKWAKSGDNWFYLKENGEMAVSQWIYEGNDAYYVDSNGAMMRNTVTPDGYYVGVNGKWIPERKSAETYTAPETVSVGMQNALKTAQSYMRWSSLSKKQLYEQLVYEGYSDAESRYGSEMVQVNWSEQCAKSAQKYMSWSSFSRKGLIDQLRYEGYTDSEIAYGLAAVGY